MYSVYQHWDPLKVCLVGKSYSPEFYSFIKNSRVRTVMERIAQETEEDYQKLISLLTSFGVQILRPNVSDNWQHCHNSVTNKINSPPMCPRDISAMIGDTFYFGDLPWAKAKGVSWPASPPKSIEELTVVPKVIQDDMARFGFKIGDRPWADVLSGIKNKIVFSEGINSAMTTRIGRDLYFGTTLGFGTAPGTQIRDTEAEKKRYSKLFPDYRCHIINTQGHVDGTFCPVKPGLIISLHDIPTYKDTFPGWEVVYLPGQSWDAIPEFLQLKIKNRGKWWVPGEELNDDFTNFVESWLGHWVGYVEESVFDVNMLVIDEKNVICNNYNEKVFEAFERHGITPHICNFRHRYFWDGGLHCITSDLHREGTLKDYFPERT